MVSLKLIYPVGVWSTSRTTTQSSESPETPLRSRLRRPTGGSPRNITPDKNPSPEVEEMFKLINGAYHVLSDPAKKAEYDALYDVMTSRASAHEAIGKDESLRGFKLKVLEALIKYFFEPFPKSVATIFIVAFVLRLVMRLAPRVKSNFLGVAFRLFEPVTAITVFQGIAFLVLLVLISIGLAYGLLQTLFWLSVGVTAATSIAIGFGAGFGLLKNISQIQIPNTGNFLANLLLLIAIPVANALSALFNNMVGVVLNSYSLVHLLHVPIRSTMGSPTVTLVMEHIDAVNCQS